MQTINLTPTTGGVTVVENGGQAYTRPLGYDTLANRGDSVVIEQRPANGGVWGRRIYLTDNLTVGGVLFSGTAAQMMTLLQTTFAAASTGEPGTAETGSTIKTKLESLTGSGRLDASAIKNLPAAAAGNYQQNLNILNIKEFGAIGDGASHPLSATYGTLAAAQAVYPNAVALTDELDGVAIQKAINQAAIGGKRVFIPEGTYMINTPLTTPSYFTIEGANMRTTIIKRNWFVPALKIIGTGGVGTGQENLRCTNVRVTNITIDGGGGYGTDLVQMWWAAEIIWENVLVIGANGKAVSCRELMDSRFKNCYFEWSGTVAGVGAIELDGGKQIDGLNYEYTNNIYFNGCRWETNWGPDVKAIGNNTNAIFMSECKCESQNSNWPRLDFFQTTGLYLRSMLIGSRGTSGNTLSDIVKLNQCFVVSLDGYIIHNGTQGVNAATLQRVIGITDSRIININVGVGSWEPAGLTTIDSNPIMADVASRPSVTATGNIIGNYTKPILNPAS